MKHLSITFALLLSLSIFSCRESEAPQQEAPSDIWSYNGSSSPIKKAILDLQKYPGDSELIRQLEKSHPMWHRSKTKFFDGVPTVIVPLANRRDTRLRGALAISYDEERNTQPYLIIKRALRKNPETPFYSAGRWIGYLKAWEKHLLGVETNHSPGFKTRKVYFNEANFRLSDWMCETYEVKECWWTEVCVNGVCEVQEGSYECDTWTEEDCWWEEEDCYDDCDCFGECDCWDECDPGCSNYSGDPCLCEGVCEDPGDPCAGNGREEDCGEDFEMTVGQLCASINFKLQPNGFNAEITGLGFTAHNSRTNRVIHSDYGVSCITIPAYNFSTGYDVAVHFANSFNLARKEVERLLNARLIAPTAAAIRARLKQETLEYLNSGSPGSKFTSGSCLGNVPTSVADYGC